MPLYEYECQACNKTFEVLQKITDDSLTSCNLCNKGPVRKLISKSGFILKGTGWYETDFKGKKPASGEANTMPKPSIEAGSSTNNNKSPTPEKAAEPAPASVKKNENT